MIYFDRKTLSILRYIKRQGDRGASWGRLREKFGEDTANIILLESLSKELYTVTKNDLPVWTNRGGFKAASSEFRSYCTPKGRELLEQISFDFWKWIIPTLISVAALVVSTLAFIAKTAPPPPAP